MPNQLPDVSEQSVSRQARPEFVRLPPPGERCCYTGLSRSTLCELCVPCAANGNHPPVVSHVLRKRGAARGIRVISLVSLIAYIRNLPNDCCEAD